MAIMAIRVYMSIYNKKACRFFCMFDQKYNTKGVHALDGNEFKITGTLYRVDYINFDFKLIIEWDEERHFRSKDQIKKDLKRQKIIQEKFPDFEFIRIRESEAFEMVTKIKPGISVDKEVWSIFKGKSKGESSRMVENFMKEYEPLLISKKKIQAGVTIDKDVWLEFKSFCAKKGIDASQELEELMRWDLDHPGANFPIVYLANDVRSFDFNLNQWNAQVNSGHLQVNNVTYANTISSGSSVTSDIGNTMQVYNSTVKDIKIE